MNRPLASEDGLRAVLPPAPGTAYTARRIGMTTPLDIGFIGLGVMGAPMATPPGARRPPAAAARCRPGAWPRRWRTRWAARHGRCDTPAALAEGCDIVITMLPNGQVVQQVALGEQGLLAGLKRRCAAARHLVGRALADAPDRGRAGRATAWPWSTRRCPARNGAPQEAKLVFMVGGSDSRPGARAPAARLHGPRGAPRRRARRGPCDEVHQQPDHRDDLQRHHGRPGARQALWAWTRRRWSRC